MLNVTWQKKLFSKRPNGNFEVQYKTLSPWAWVLPQKIGKILLLLLTLLLLLLLLEPTNLHL